MHDPRIDQLARQLVRHSTKITKGDHVLIELVDAPDSIALALIHEVRACGGFPFIRIHRSRLTREMFKGAQEEQYGALSKHLLSEINDIDACIHARSSSNISETSDVPQANMRLAMKLLRPAMDHRIKNTRRCLIRWPNASMAQQAGMPPTCSRSIFWATACARPSTQNPPGTERRARQNTGLSRMPDSEVWIFAFSR